MSGVSAREAASLSDLCAISRRVGPAAAVQLYVLAALENQASPELLSKLLDGTEINIELCHAPCASEPKKYAQRCKSIRDQLVPRKLRTIRAEQC